MGLGYGFRVWVQGWSKVWAHCTCSGFRQGVLKARVRDRRSSRVCSVQATPNILLLLLLLLPNNLLPVSSAGPAVGTRARRALGAAVGRAGRDPRPGPPPSPQPPGLVRRRRHPAPLAALSCRSSPSGRRWGGGSAKGEIGWLVESKRQSASFLLGFWRTAGCRTPVEQQTDKPPHRPRLVIAMRCLTNEIWGVAAL